MEWGGRVDEILLFMEDWKSGKELKEKYELSNSEFFHMKCWMIKGHYVEECEVSGILSTEFKKLDGTPKGKTNRTALYRTRKLE